MADLARRVPLACVRAAVEDDAGADAGADLDDEEIVRTVAPKKVLGEGDRAGVVDDMGRNREPLTYDGLTAFSVAGP